MNTVSPEQKLSPGSVRDQQFAIRLSLVVGFFMLAGKWYAYVLTGSAAILSDAAESIVHVFAVAFAAYSLWLSFKPADPSHPYGHEKVGFFSAGVEGALIILAAITIMYEAVKKWMEGLELQNLGEGTAYVAAAAGINALLGTYLFWKGKKYGSLVLTANGKHVLTDVWTSAGVVGGLLLVVWTGWKPFDPILALIVASNILWSGGKLVRQSVGGLMDEGDPALARVIKEILERETRARNLEFHEVRYRNAGTTLWIEFHLLFPRGTPIEAAHWKATEIEGILKTSLKTPVNIITHLEPIEGHDTPHRELKASAE
ncbi:MAG: cation diffusion facilitator transporter [Bacteroidia bacterium]|nr:MAG: cation diffusion facilitator transporter [Bacteroidia bacterium]